MNTMIAAVIATIAMVTAVASQESVNGDAVPMSLLFPAQDGSVPCNPNICRLPWCYCSGTAIPGNIDPRMTPQIVMLTFQNAVNVQNFELYQRLFRGRRNPNGCPASGTFFVSHNYTDYFYVQSLYSQRHEIADNTVTSQPPADYWARGSMYTWYQELSDQRTILSAYGGVKFQDVVGVRAPYLQPGGDNQYGAMYRAGFKYDASRTTVQFSGKNNYLWPYTYDYPSTQDCPVPPCPIYSYPGMWQIPLPYLQDTTGRQCVTTQGCPNVNTPYDAFQLLNDTFTAHYTSNNRAPLIIPVDTAWLMTDYKMAGTLRFLDVLSTMRDVYLVTASQAIAWCKQPTPLYSISSFQPWKCSTAPPSVCDESRVNNCYYDDRRRTTSSAAAVWRMRTCSTCPRCYPAVGDPYGSFC